jgi:hypothetical protein
VYLFTFDLTYDNVLPDLQAALLLPLLLMVGRRPTLRFTSLANTPQRPHVHQHATLRPLQERCRTLLRRIAILEQSLAVLWEASLALHSYLVLYFVAYAGVVEDDRTAMPPQGRQLIIPNSMVTRP